MRLFRHYHRLPDDVRGGAVAIGNFDGVHLGHRAVIEEAGLIARATHIPWSVLTLEPHPRSVFNPSGPPFRLTPFSAKADLIATIGPESLIAIPFDLEFSRMPARDFVERVMVKALAARHVVCGHDFAFGHGRQGTPEVLLHLADEFGFEFTCVHELRDAYGEPYSSTRIRNHLKNGDPRAAARLLGRPFAIEGEVVEGERRGRTIGFPTANLHLGEYLQPALGVYAVQARIADRGNDSWYQGVANIGLRPTFGGNDILLEAHLFDFSGDLYSRDLCVALIEYLRAEKKFDGIDSLRAQIAEDSARARHVLAQQAAPAAFVRASNQ